MKNEHKKGICPTCGKEFVVQEHNLLPFCCKRCKMIDLGHWLGEKYVVDEQSIKKKNDTKNE